MEGTYCKCTVQWVLRNRYYTHVTSIILDLGKWGPCSTPCISRVGDYALQHLHYNFSRSSFVPGQESAISSGWGWPEYRMGCRVVGDQFLPFKTHFEPLDPYPSCVGPPRIPQGYPPIPQGTSGFSPVGSSMTLTFLGPGFQRAAWQGDWSTSHCSVSLTQCMKRGNQLTQWFWMIQIVPIDRGHAKCIFPGSEHPGSGHGKITTAIRIDNIFLVVKSFLERLCNQSHSHSLSPTTTVLLSVTLG